ncbi:NADP-dependent oxidoreductase [Naasia lichenicola]|uniref:NADP-dependent oxidoreductase n=1 Tax=Naasia lichenicola TaxID=2565933 RepID=A0A4V3WT18_9MICO|nr:NADP-dependent oxidoreductase [Naasia lichenicola]THG30037.1 NADP-dependent oxidoreductase [Naasia lichenicola]
MKAIQYHALGGPEVLRYEDVEQPVPGVGEVRIRVAGSAFNAADNGIRWGRLPIPVTLPHIPGYDVSGTVDAVGGTLGGAVRNDESGISVGDSVVGFLPMTDNGSAAEYVIAPSSVLTKAPSNIPLADAAALPSVGLTAWQALFDEAALVAGQRVLIVGAGGAVGGIAVQLATSIGAYVIATASPRSSATVTAAGADIVIDHTTTSVADAMTEPVDVLLNLAPIEQQEFVDLVGHVRDGGVVVSTTAWMPAPADEDRQVRSTIIYVRSDVDELTKLVSMIDGGELRLEAPRRVPLGELIGIHAQADAGELRGKIVAVPDPA